MQDQVEAEGTATADDCYLAMFCASAAALEDANAQCPEGTRAVASDDPNEFDSELGADTCSLTIRQTYGCYAPAL